jgi:hypothetical protein
MNAAVNVVMASASDWIVGCWSRSMMTPPAFARGHEPRGEACPFRAGADLKRLWRPL